MTPQSSTQMSGRVRKIFKMTNLTLLNNSCSLKYALESVPGLADVLVPKDMGMAPQLGPQGPDQKITRTMLISIKNWRDWTHSCWPKGQNGRGRGRQMSLLIRILVYLEVHHSLALWQRILAGGPETLSAIFFEQSSETQTGQPQKSWKCKKKILFATKVTSYLVL